MTKKIFSMKNFKKPEHGIRKCFWRLQKFGFCNIFKSLTLTLSMTRKDENAFFHNYFTRILDRNYAKKL
jgi:hypothetical protein